MPIGHIIMSRQYLNNLTPQMTRIVNDFIMEGDGISIKEVHINGVDYVDTTLNHHDFVQDGAPDNQYSLYIIMKLDHVNKREPVLSELRQMKIIDGVKRQKIIKAYV